MAEATADDRVLALLARSSNALERAEIAEVLGWSVARAGEVLRRLESTSVVVSLAGKRPPGESGRSPMLYELAKARTAEAGNVARAPLARGTRVITPSDREARVVGVRDGRFVEIEYLTVRPGHEPRTTIHFSLLAPFNGDDERPAPVRVGAR